MYAFCQDMPGLTLEEQTALASLIPADALERCIAHVVGPIDGGIRMIDVWDSEADYREFQRQHLYPALARLQKDLPLEDTRGLRPFSVLDVSGEGHTATPTGS